MFHSLICSSGALHYEYDNAPSINSSLDATTSTTSSATTAALAASTTLLMSGIVSPTPSSSMTPEAALGADRTRSAQTGCVLYVCLYVCMYVCLFVCVFVRSFVHLSVSVFFLLSSAQCDFATATALLHRSKRRHRRRHHRLSRRHRRRRRLRRRAPRSHALVHCRARPTVNTRKNDDDDA